MAAAAALFPSSTMEPESEEPRESEAARGDGVKSARPRPKGDEGEG